MAKKNNGEQWSLTLLRVVIGLIFVMHGYPKLFVTGGFTGTVDFFDKIGIPAPTYSALVSSAVEFFGGLLLIVGALTKLSSILLLINFLTAFFVVHLKNGFFISQGGYEYVIVLIAGLVVVLANGSGKLSLGSGFKSKILQ